MLCSIKYVCFGLWVFSLEWIWKIIIQPCIRFIKNTLSEINIWLPIKKIYIPCSLSYVNSNGKVAQSAGAVEYTDCTSAEEKPASNESPVYDSKQSDGEVPVMLGLWRIRSTPLFPLLQLPFWPIVVAPDKALCMG